MRAASEPRTASRRIPYAWTAAVLLPMWVGFSRVYEAQHNPFDVLAGLAMGFAVLCVTVAALSPRRNRDEQ